MRGALLAASDAPRPYRHHRHTLPTTGPSPPTPYQTSSMRTRPFHQKHNNQSKRNQIRKHFPSFPERSPQELYAALNVVKDPSLIRVEADEVRGAREESGVM